MAGYHSIDEKIGCTTERVLLGELD